MNSTVTVYSAAWCAFCKMAKEYLTSKDVAYKEVDVDHDQTAAMYIVDKTGQAGIPVIQIGDEYIVGFDRPKIDAALEKQK